MNQVKKDKKRGIKIPLLKILCILLILMMGVTIFLPISIIMKIITLIGLVYLTFVSFIIQNESRIIQTLGTGEFNEYNKTYLNTVIDSLELAKLSMHFVNSLEDFSSIDITEHIKRVEGAYAYLSKIEPPKKYSEYHNNILNELKFFLDKYNDN